jgi:peptidoglycan/LPS O-acetylase OafA/YrhL
MNPSTQKVNLDKYSIPIDGLRAIAVIVVIINHFKESLLTSGYLGVDVFFVISGFVITASLLKRKQTTAKTFFGGFYKRRVKRLVPALLLCFIVASLSISFFALQPHKYINTGLFSLPGFANIDLYLNAVDYWGESSKFNPFTHTWSLAVEEQFYYFYPLIVWFLFSRKVVSGSINKLFIAISALSVLSLGAYIYTVTAHPMATYFLMPFRFWEIGLGCLLYLQLRKFDNDLIRKITAKIPLTVFLILSLAVFFLPKADNGYTTIAIVFITYFILLKVKLAEVSENTAELKLLDNKVMVYLGKISYSLYLWHWIIITLARWTIGISLETAPVIIVLFVGLSVLSYHLIEMPLRHASWRKELRPKLSLAIMLLPFLLIIYAFKFKTVNRFYLGNPPMQDTAQYEAQLTPVLESTSCSKMRVFGNSHSLHIVPMLKVIAKKYNIELIKQKEENYILIPNGDGKDLNKLDKALEPMSTGDLLILSSRMRYIYEDAYLNGSGEKWVDHKDQKAELGYGLDMWLNELNEVIDQSKVKGVNVVLFLPNVEFDTPVPNNQEICSEQWFRNPSSECNPSVSIEFLQSRFPKEWYDAVYELEAEHANFFLFDPLPIYCDDPSTCWRIVDGITAFRDTHHLTPAGALMMLDEFYAFLLEKELL